MSVKKRTPFIRQKIFPVSTVLPIPINMHFDRDEDNDAIANMPGKLYVWDVPVDLRRSEVFSQLFRWPGIKAVLMLRPNRTERSTRRDLSIEFENVSDCLHSFRKIIWLRNVPYRMKTVRNGSSDARRAEKRWQKLTRAKYYAYRRST